MDDVYISEMKQLPSKVIFEASYFLMLIFLFCDCSFAAQELYQQFRDLQVVLPNIPLTH